MHNQFCSTVRNGLHEQGKDGQHSFSLLMNDNKYSLLKLFHYECLHFLKKENVKGLNTPTSGSLAGIPHMALHLTFSTFKLSLTIPVGNKQTHYELIQQSMKELIMKMEF